MTQPYVSSGIPGYICWLNHLAHLYVDMDTSPETIIKCNSIFWIWRLMIHFSTCHDTNKARLKLVFIALQASSKFGCWWEKGHLWHLLKLKDLSYLVYMRFSYRGGLELQIQSHRSWWSNWMSMRAMYFDLPLLLKWPGSNFNT